MFPRPIVLASLVVLAGLTPSAPAAPTAIQIFGAITAQMRDAHAANDWTALHAGAVKLVELLNGSPDALLELARADERLGDRAGALANLRAMAAMGQSTAAVADLPEFAALGASNAFKPIAARMAENLKPVEGATQAFVVPDAGLLPEDIDYDAAGKRFFLTSVLEKKIVTLDANGAIADFARSPDGWPVMALKIDAAHGAVWATEVALEGFANVPKADWGRSAILRYGLATGKLEQRIEAHAAFGDMTLSPDGEPLVSDNAGGGTYVLQSTGALERVDAGDFISPQTAAYLADGRAVVPDYVRGLGVLDAKTKSVAWIPMQSEYALAGVDGLYARANTLIAVQNGTNPDRVVVFTYDVARNRISAMETIDSGTPSLDPNHGVVVGNAFYYIANAGWDALADDGTVKKGAALTSARIMRAELAR